MSAYKQLDTKRMSQASNVSFSASKGRESVVPNIRESVMPNIDPVFTTDPSVTRLNTKNYLNSIPNGNNDDSVDDISNSYSETQIVIKDFGEDDEKFDKDFRKFLLILDSMHRELHLIPA